MKHEENLHIAVCNYLRLQYPNVIFTSESSGIRLTMGQAVKAKKLRSSAKLPDLWIMERRAGYGGLFLELKKDRKSVYLKDGVTLSSSEHIREQNKMIGVLITKGYLAGFACGFQDAKEIIDYYMKMSEYY